MKQRLGRADQGRTSVTNAWISETRSRSEEEEVRSDSEPDNPVVVDQTTFQWVVTDTVNSPSGSDAEARA
jgi:hypothetical protein